ncbi:DUF2284 domain-containing protein [Chloroflexota bacterium]
MVRKISDEVPRRVLLKDLEKYRQIAIELGSIDAKTITTDMILIDERVRAKCLYPKCASYGTNANCPPHALELDSVREIVNTFQYAIFTRLNVPAGEMAGPEASAKRLYTRSLLKNHEIISKIEAEAFYDGYYLALGFAGGPCKSAFCPNNECSALVSGQACRHPFRARSSMEGAGMDAFRMAAMVGWDIYPIGASVLPTEIPHGTRLGLVLIY